MEADKMYIIIYSHGKAVQNGDDFHALMIGAGYVSFIITVLRSWCVESCPFHPPVFVQASWTMKPESLLIDSLYRPCSVLLKVVAEHLGHFGVSRL